MVFSKMISLKVGSFSLKITYLSVLLLSESVGGLQNYGKSTGEDNNEKNYYRENNNFDNGSEPTVCTAEDLTDLLAPDDLEEGTNMAISKHVNHINETFERLFRLRNIGQNAFNTLMTPFIPRLIEMSYTAHLSLDCLASIAFIFNAMAKQQLWAFKFIDSFGSIPSGITEGCISDFGQYEQCLDIESPIEYVPTIRGQYCLLKLIVPYEIQETKESEIELDFFGDSFTLNKLSRDSISPLLNRILRATEGATFHIGICVPSTCKPEELENVTNQALFPLLRLPVEFRNDCSIKNQQKTLRLDQKVSVLILSVITFIISISTLIELSSLLFFSGKVYEKSSFLNKTKQLSIIYNTKKLYEEQQKLPSIEFIRVLATIWVFMIHSYVLLSSDQRTIKRMPDMVKKMVESKLLFFIKFAFIMDAFTLISGFITSYALLGRLTRTGGKFSYIGFVSERWIKFTLVLNGHLLFTYLYDSYGNGPLWNRYNDFPYIKNCQNRIESNLIYFQNYQIDVFNVSYLCSPYSWFFCVILHLHMISPLIILPLYKYQKSGFWLNIMVIVLGCILILIPYWMFGVSPIYQFPKSLQAFRISTKYLLFRTEIYLTSYSIGILFGYLTRKYPNVYLGGKYGEFLIWVISLSLTVYTVLWNEYLIELTRNGYTSRLSNLLYLSVGKITWTIGICWFIYATTTGRAEKMHSFAKWKGFQLMGKLSIGIYLFHPRIILSTNKLSKQTYVLNEQNIWNNAIVNFVQSILFAYAFYLVIECPLVFIYNYLFNKTKTESQSELNNEHVDETESNIYFVNNATAIESYGSTTI